MAKEKIAASGLVAGRLGVFDCSGVSDGAAAALIVRAEDAHRLESNLLNMEHNKVSIAYIKQNMALRERELACAEKQAAALDRIANMMENRR